MKVIQLFGSLNHGGAEILTLDVCKQFPDEIGEQILVTYRGGSLEDTFNEHNIPFNKISKGFMGFHLMRQLRKLIREYDVSIIHSHKSLDTIYSKVASFGYPVKVVQTVHSLGYGYMYNILRRIINIMVDQTMFVSQDILIRYRKHNKLPKNYSVLYNGIDMSKFNVHSKNCAHIYSELNISEGSIIAGMIGNFNSGRDHLTVCKALNEIIPTNPHVHFIFVGGAQNLEFEAICKHYCEVNNIIKNIHFLGSRTDVPKILNALDIFVYSSNSDTFGIAVVEAMMSGIPVIVNDLDVFKEITDNGAFAQLYRTKDVTDLAEKIEDYIKHPEKRKELGEKGQAWAMEKFTIERHVNQLTEIYNSVLAL